MPSRESKRKTGPRSGKKRKTGRAATKKGEAAGPSVTVQFSHECDEDEQLGNIHRLIGKKHIASMEQVFPGEKDPELGTLVVLTLDESAPVEETIDTLNADDEIEIAHVAAERKPQRSIGRNKNGK